MVHLDYRDARPIYVQIMDGIRQQISGGVLQPGDRLPSVREMAQELAINPNTIQRSYRQLEMEGWIAPVPGKGCFVSGTAHTDLREEKKLLEAFDDTVRGLLELGYTRQELVRRIGKEDIHD